MSGKILSLIFVFLSAPAVLLLAQYDNDKSVSIPMKSSEITIDGILNDWPMATLMNLNSQGLVKGSQWRGEADLSLRLSMCWDEVGIYFAADIRDQQYLGKPSRTQAWNADSLVFVFNFPTIEDEKNALYVFATRENQQPRLFALKGRGTVFNRYDLTDSQVATRDRDNLAPVFEGILPWSDLLGHGQEKPAHFNLNIEVRDLDEDKSFKSISWCPSTASASGEMEIGLAMLELPGDLTNGNGERMAGDIRHLVQLVQIPVVVMDKNNGLVKDLFREDFQVFEDDVEQQIVDFHLETRPITIGLLVDSSGSMEWDIGSVKEAAGTFLDSLREEDRAFVIAFNHNIELLKDFDGGADEAKEALDSMVAYGATRLYDTLNFALRKLRYLREKKILILFSDGKDESQGTTSLYGYEVRMPQIIEEAKREQVIVYVIAYRLNDSTALNEMNSLAAATGGRVFTASNAENIIDAYHDIADELKSQYLISYRSTNSNADGLWREIEVNIRDRDYNVRTREGYYAPQK